MIKVKVREKYLGLSRQELLDEAYKLGFNYEKNSKQCSQCTTAALHKILEIDDVVVRVANSSCGGQADQAVGTCGGLIGGTIVLDYFFGRPPERMSCQETTEANIKLGDDAVEIAKLLYDRYINEYGTILCPHIQAQLFGRHYYFWEPDDEEKFEKAGAPDKCSHLVATVARWTMEILLDKGAIELKTR